MEINDHGNLCAELRRWASSSKRETVAAEITKHYFAQGGGKLPLYPVEAPGATYNNMQNIFRWLDSDTPRARAKIGALRPAIVSALAERSHGTMPYLVAQAQKEFSEAIGAALLDLPNMEIEISEAIAALHVLKNRPGSVRNAQPTPARK